MLKDQPERREEPPPREEGHEEGPEELEGERPDQQTQAEIGSLVGARGSERTREITTPTKLPFLVLNTYD